MTDRQDHEHAERKARESEHLHDIDFAVTHEAHRPG